MRGSPTPSPRPASKARRVVVLTFVALALIAVGGSAACGTAPIGVEACQRIERVRCECAPACQIDLRRLLHSGSSSTSDVASCTRYYEDQCLHGLVTTKEPSPQSVDACVAAIAPINGTCDCTVVKTPEVHPSCQFLVPPVTATTTDASTDADADADADAD